MMDAYSFDASAAMDASFEVLREAFHRLFAALGLPVVAVQADSGAIGGQESVEFVLPSPGRRGHHRARPRPTCGYAANLEKAELGPPGATRERPKGRLRRWRSAPPSQDDRRPRGHAGSTPPRRSRPSLPGRPRPGSGARRGRGLRRDQGRPGGERDEAAPGAGHRRPAPGDGRREWAAAGLVAGSASPVGVSGVRTVVDRSVPEAGGLVAGGNRRACTCAMCCTGGTTRPAPWRTSAPPGRATSAPAAGGPHAGEGDRLGHIFKLGVRYSEALGARYLDAEGAPAALVDGLLRNRRRAHPGGRRRGGARRAGHRLAPRPGPLQRAPRGPRLRSARPDPVADALYQELQEAGLSVLLDDRVESAGAG